MLDASRQTIILILDLMTVCVCLSHYTTVIRYHQCLNRQNVDKMQRDEGVKG